MIEFVNLTAGYNNNIIVKNSDFTVGDNEIVTIIGANGCGKSTLIKCINEEAKIFDGKILLDGRDISKLSRRERAVSVSVLPQIRQVPVITAKKLVEHGRFPHLSFSRNLSGSDKAIAKEAMSFTNTFEFKDTTLDKLSGGQRQRVYIAMTLAQNCKNMILDEPTTFMDAFQQKELMRLILRLRENGKTLLLILHDIISALKYSDKIIVMDRGCILDILTPDRLLESGMLNELFGINVICVNMDGNKYYAVD